MGDIDRPAAMKRTTEESIADFKRLLDELGPVRALREIRMWLVASGRYRPFNVMLSEHVEAAELYVRDALGAWGFSDEEQEESDVPPK